MLFFTLNCAAALYITGLICNKLIDIVKKPRSISAVLFGNSLSVCCNGSGSDVNECPNRYCSKKKVDFIVDLINGSERSICLALYSLNLREVRKAIINASKRKVKVRVLTTEESIKNLSRDFTELSISGIPVRFPLGGGKERLLHHKFCIIDGEDAKQSDQETHSLPAVLTGSMNWTLDSFSSNWDAIIVLSDSELVDKYQQEFDSIWDSLKPKAMNEGKRGFSDESSQRINDF